MCTPHVMLCVAFKDMLLNLLIYTALKVVQHIVVLDVVCTIYSDSNKVKGKHS
jgi:hypothetical protein